MQSFLKKCSANPGASIGELSTTIDRSKTTTVAALHRLKDAGLVENRDRSWRLVEEPAPREPASALGLSCRRPQFVSTRTPEFCPQDVEGCLAHSLPRVCPSCRGART